jgi:Mrp family chromosome partitioning ATPase/uncharacterized protein involved in exopolysaccharide biosynthesis
MNEKRTAATPAGMNIGDIYHVLFRHKWKILLVWAIGLVSTAVLWLAWPVPYQSEATLLIKYVKIMESPNPSAGESNMKVPTLGAEAIINSQLQILESLDLAQQVADTFGPNRILAKFGGGTNNLQAAGVVKSGLKTELPEGGGVIRVIFQHPDRDLVQPVLGQLINSYLKRYGEIYNGQGMWDEALRRQKDELHATLTQTENDLRKEQDKGGIKSPDDLKNLYLEHSVIRQAMFAAEVELADHQAALNAMMRLAPSNTLAAASLEITNTPPPEKISKNYRLICKVLESNENQLTTLLTEGSKPESGPVKFVQKAIDDYQKRKEDLEKQYPQLVQMRPAPTTPTDPTEQPIVSRAAIFAEATRLTGLQNRTNILSQQLVGVLEQIKRAEDSEARIRQLESDREQQQKNLDYISLSLQRATYDEALSVGRNFNISTIQSPTPPSQDRTKLFKVVRGMALGTLAGGLALAFLLEMFLDRSFKRPIEVEAKLGLPLLLSIPETNLNGKHSRWSTVLQNSRLLSWKSGESKNGAVETPPAGTPESLPLEATKRLQPFFEALRDRMIMFFEMKSMTYKPKLVAVTSCGAGAGVTTVASGLAASLSETGDGNVLLVDMNVEGGAAHYFHKGELACGLEEALETDKREGALVQEKLYVVSDSPSTDKLPRILHKRFSSLMPKLKASDYDYIIFDMPPMSQISTSSRIARFMDLVLLVVESEKTDRDVAKRATEMLTESTANVRVVLNKTRTYIPQRLVQNS